MTFKENVQVNRWALQFHLVFIINAKLGYLAFYPTFAVARGIIKKQLSIFTLQFDHTIGEIKLNKNDQQIPKQLGKEV